MEDYRLLRRLCVSLLHSWLLRHLQDIEDLTTKLQQGGMIKAMKSNKSKRTSDCIVLNVPPCSQLSGLPDYLHIHPEQDLYWAATITITNIWRKGCLTWCSRWGSASPAAPSRLGCEPCALDLRTTPGNIASYCSSMWVLCEMLVVQVETFISAGVRPLAGNLESPVVWKIINISFFRFFFVKDTYSKHASLCHMF